MSGAKQSDRLSEHEKCSQEPIHIIGQIQAHGLLFALSEPSLEISHVSANVSRVLGLAPETLLGNSIKPILGAQQFDALQSQAGEGRSVKALRMEMPAAGGKREFNCLCHRRDGIFIAEFEPTAGAHSLDPLNVDSHLRIPLKHLELGVDLAEMARLTAEEIRKLSGFSRVMVYRFDDDWNGEVLAEAAGASPVSYLGLHFPASDIPAQARALFLVNPVRTIADVYSVPAPILPATGTLSGRPLDLTLSVLRSASPVYIKYLRNMGVAASLTISIIVKQRLWGMIFCHSAGPWRVDHSTRSLCDLIGQVLSSQIVLRSDHAALQSRLASRRLLEKYWMGVVEAAKRP